MGCASSLLKTLPSGGRKKRKNRSGVDEVVVFVPMLQVPMPVDFLHPLRGLLSRELIDKLSSLRNRIVSLSEENDVNDVAALQQALEEYLPILLGLTVKEHNLESLVEFKWRVLCEDEEETCIDSAWYEVLSVVHLMATLSMLQANLMLVPNKSSDECEREVSEDSKKFAVDLLLKASGCLDYCLRDVMVNLPLHCRKNLPHGLQEGMLEAMSTQALAQGANVYAIKNPCCNSIKLKNVSIVEEESQTPSKKAVDTGVEMQLGLALECEKATLSVKRRLACEAVSYFAQAHSCLTGCYTNDGYGKKLLLFIQWKYLEAKAAAYYYHGLVLNKGSAPSDHVSAVCCLFAAEELLRDGRKACLSFCLAAPVTRVPPVWGVMKHVNKKIPETASKKAQMYGYLFEQDKGSQSLPDLPEFQLSLKPDDYNLPDIDASWDNEKFEPQIQSLKEHLKDEDEVVET